MKKFILVVILVLCMAGVAIADNQIRVMVNGKLLNSDAVMINDRVFVPLRAVGEALGAKVDWDGSKAVVNTNTDMGTPIISGDANQKAKVEAALRLLKEKDPADYELVCRYVKFINTTDTEKRLGSALVIREINNREVIAESIYLTSTLLDKNDSIFTAAVLVHEATHLCNAHNKDIASNIKNDENIAYMRGISTLRILGAPQQIIDQAEYSRIQAIK